MVVLEYALLFVMTLAAYFGSLWLYHKSRSIVLHPVIISSGLIILVLYLFGVSYESYESATWLIDFLLGPTVVALGWALYKQLEHLKAHWASILTSVTVGSLVGILSVVAVMRLFHTPRVVEVSMMAKSVTTPIALKITEHLNGVAGITSFVVILTGILGSIIAPAILKRLGVTDAIARGLAIGSAAHGIGTARAMELGAIEGAISGMAIGLMGLVTALLIPLVEWVLG